MEDIFDSVVGRAVGISSSHPITGALSEREDILRLTEASHDAALKPEPSGGLSHSERAALACRMSLLNFDYELASHYQKMISETEASIADPNFYGGDDTRLKAIIVHTDLITRHPKDATAGDITALKAAGVMESDIVCLSELIAFTNYQARLTAGLRLMTQA